MAYYGIFTLRSLSVSEMDFSEKHIFPPCTGGRIANAMAAWHISGRMQDSVNLRAGMLN